MKNIPVTVIVTVLNEEHTIIALLNALYKQTYQPTQTIFIDGGSSDDTVDVAKKWHASHKAFPLSIKVHPGNRSRGRNAAIAQAKTEIIAITDAGCEPHQNWLQELVKTYTQSNAEIVAGFYEGKAATAFQEAVIPYALVMPDRFNPDTFLPATRSMLLEKSAWKKLGKFGDSYSDNEDYVFAKALEKSTLKRAATKKAIVTWYPPKNFQAFLRMIFRFARGDVTAGIIRPKVVFLFGRYALGVILLRFVFEHTLIWAVIIAGLFFYSLWAILKNYRWVPQGWYYLPALQFGSDIAVLSGSVIGLISRVKVTLFRERKS